LSRYEHKYQYVSGFNARAPDQIITKALAKKRPQRVKRSEG